MVSGEIPDSGLQMPDHGIASLGLFLKWIEFIDPISGILDLLSDSAVYQVTNYIRKRVLNGTEF